MLRRFCLTTSAVVSLTASASAESYTTRIETRPFYGAVVTLEEGIRVIRPLPPERHVIINPDGRTPLSLGFNDTRVYENRQIYNYSDAGGSEPSYGRVIYGTNGYYAPGYGSYGAEGLRGHGGGAGIAVAPGHRAIAPHQHLHH